MRRITIVFLALSLCASARVVGQTNSWTGSSNNWDFPSAWSLNQPPSFPQDVLITNTGTFTVTIDFQTVITFPSIKVSSLTLSNPLGSTTLLLTNRPQGPQSILITVTNTANIGMGAVLNIVDLGHDHGGAIMQVSNLVVNGTVILQTNSRLSASGSSPDFNVHMGSITNSTGTVTVLGGSLTGSIGLGEQGTGNLVISNGIVQSPRIVVGTQKGGSGLWQIAGGVCTVTNLAFGSFAGSTGQVVITGGQLNTGSISVGGPANNCLVISNGVLQCPAIDVSAVGGGTATWQIAGGVNTVTNLSLASSPGSAGAVVMTGGQLNLSTISFGQFGNSYFVANGVFQCPSIDVTALAGGQAFWQIAGGTSTVGNVMLGSFANSTGQVVMTGGLLNVGSINFGGGVNSSASLVLSNGTLNTGELDLAKGVGGVGTLTVAGGTLNGSANMYIGYQGTGTVWLTGGEIDVTNNGPNTGLIRLVGSGFLTRPYLSQLVCSGGVLRATEVDLSDPQAPTGPGLSSWTIAGGTSIVNNAVYVDDDQDTSLLTVSGGVLQTPLLDVGSESGGGAVVITGGTVIPQALIVGLAPGHTSQVSVAGGSLIVTNVTKLASIGGGGPGQIFVSSGTFSANTIEVGASPISFGKQPGILSISGGTVKGNLLVGEDSASGSTGTVWATGGNLPDNITIGDTGIGVMYVLSNVVFHPSGIVTVGNRSGAVGSLNLQGGTSFSAREIDALEIGAKAGSTGTVWVTDGLFQAFGGCGFTLVGEQGSGRLSATNSTLQLYSITIGSQGTIECVGSELLLIGPCTTVNNNFISLVNSTLNSYSLVNNAGTIVANNSTLTFFQPVNNSGCIVATNGTVLFSGGITNSGAVVLGPNQFCITSVVATGSDLLITWPAFGGNHYRVQAATDPAASYLDITTDIVASGTGLGTTNYVDAGGVTNSPSRFYKIRQVY
jgi:fibronectin-binding autotransporter adhesin